MERMQVLERCYGSLLPSSSDYLSTHLNPADLNGPFWTLTALIFALFLSSSLAASITAYVSDPNSEGDFVDYDFGLLSIAVPLTYAYGLALPVILWVALRYLGVGEWSVVEAIAIWGYGMFVWIPVSVRCPPVRWSLVGIAFALSGWFLVRNVYPILASAEAKATRLRDVIITALHAGLTITFKEGFVRLSVYSEFCTRWRRKGEHADAKEWRVLSYLGAASLFISNTASYLIAGLRAPRPQL
ncbi:hypothetical protein B0H13DRAFT_1717928 [Mycena leptocephala]|nr:hypothetical protein B0H13DRAFT_1717928 [Mycena leptocephala]